MHIKPLKNRKSSTKSIDKVETLRYTKTIR
nr:MAG TPA: hypothetical protein [Caudoviricetes sp.]